MHYWKTSQTTLVQQTSRWTYCLRHYNWWKHCKYPPLESSKTKYTKEELCDIIHDENKPIFVAVDEQDKVLGYSFGMFVSNRNNNSPDITTYYIDDLCVDEKLRGKHIGKELYDAAVELAKENGCYNVTLNVWSCNPSALRFYESCGLVPQKICMEQILWCISAIKYVFLN